MPRQARIDIEGGLYHVMGRGAGRRKIFGAEDDRRDFLKRLRASLRDTGSICLAWCLMPTHFHLLIRRGARPLADMMRRLMTGYAVGFNARYRRRGRLFRNRYRAILCEESAYLSELAAYIHLNPLRAGLVATLEELKTYPWCGHGALCAGERDAIVSVREMLGHFGHDPLKARLDYEEFIAERVGRYQGREYSGGGFLRSAGYAPGSSGAPGEKEAFDERILGSRDFVASIVGRTGGEEAPAGRMTKEEAVREVELVTGVNETELRSSCRRPQIAHARALYCYLRKAAGGVNGAVIMKELNVSSGAVSYLAYKGREIAESGHLSGW